MAGCLAHRGPDDEGIWTDESRGVVLGHRRLSIIDLTPGCHQPMVSASGRFVMVFNGENNYRELRGTLEGQGCRLRSALGPAEGRGSLGSSTWLPGPPQQDLAVRWSSLRDDCRCACARAVRAVPARWRYGACLTATFPAILSSAPRERSGCPSGPGSVAPCASGPRTSCRRSGSSGKVCSTRSSHGRCGTTTCPVVATPGTSCGRCLCCRHGLSTASEDEWTTSTATAAADRGDPPKKV